MFVAWLKNLKCHEMHPIKEKFKDRQAPNVFFRHFLSCYTNHVGYMYSIMYIRTAQAF